MMMAGMLTTKQKTLAAPAKKRRGRKNRAKPVTIAANPWEAGPMMAERLVVEPVGELKIDLDQGKHKFVGPAGMKRARREPWIDIYHRKGKLTDRQHTIADALAKAAAGQTITDPLVALRVDTSMGGCPQAARIDARRSYFRMMGMISEDCRPMIKHLIVEDLPIPSRGGRMAEVFLKKFCNGLDQLAAIFDNTKACAI